MKNPQVFQQIYRNRTISIRKSQVYNKFPFYAYVDGMPVKKRLHDPCIRHYTDSLKKMLKHAKSFINDWYLFNDVLDYKLNMKDFREKRELK